MEDDNVPGVRLAVKADAVVTKSDGRRSAYPLLIDILRAGISVHFRHVGGLESDATPVSVKGTMLDSKGFFVDVV